MDTATRSHHATTRCCAGRRSRPADDFVSAGWALLSLAISRLPAAEPVVFENVRHPRAGASGRADRSSFIAKRSLAIFGDLERFDFERLPDALRGDRGESGAY